MSFGKAVGGMRGGAVVMNIGCGEARVALPGVEEARHARAVKPGIVIPYGRADDVVPFADSEELAPSSGVTLIEVGTDHWLADPEPLAAVSAGCEG